MGINFEGLVALYSLSSSLPIQSGIRNVIDGISSLPQPQEERVQERIAAIFTNIRALSASLQHQPPITCLGGGNEGRRLEAWGNRVVEVIRDADTDLKLIGVYKAIKGVVEKRLEGGSSVSDVIRSELERQSELFRKSELSDGIAGLFELQSRPGLKYAQELRFLGGLAPILKGIIHSFCKEKGETAGEKRLEQLFQIFSDHRETISDLLPPNSPASQLVRRILIREEDLYSKIKKSLLSYWQQMNGSDRLTEETLLEFILNEAREVGARIPRPMRGVSSREVAIHSAFAFMMQSSHGGGARLDGSAGLNFFSGVGGGIGDSRPSTVFDQQNDPGLRRRDTQRAADLARRNEIVQQFEAGDLDFTDATFDQIFDDFCLIIEHKLANYRRDRGAAFELTPGQKRELAPVVAKETLLSGIQRNLIPLQEIDPLLRAFRLDGDRELQNLIAERRGQ